VAYAKAKLIDVDAIPVINVAPLFDGAEGERMVGRQLLDTVQRIGFFYIENHGVPQAKIDRAVKMGGRFFHMDRAQKETVRVADYHRGFLPVGEATMSGARNPDYKESFIWGWDVDPDDPDIERSNRILAPNRWPDALPELKASLDDYIETVNGLGIALLRAFAAGLDLPHDHFVRHFDKPLTRAAVVYYPPQPEEMGESQFGVSPHTDYGCITILHQDEIGGLQVKDRNGDWLTAHPMPGTFVVNVGDLLHRWSNDRFISNPHRVINASGKERFSVPVFVDPNWDTVIEPVPEPGGTARHAPIGCAEYIHGIYQRSFAYRTEDAN
jgi:isopenicillin N synthase-like dioxygenase